MVAAAVVGSAVVGGVASNKAASKQADAAKDAANLSAESSRYATDIQKQIYDQNRADQLPWQQAGQNALAQLRTGTADPNSPYLKAFDMSDYQQDPGYNFRLSEGLKAIQNSAAARGGLLSGSALKGISRYSQDQASQEYQNAFNRYQTNQTNGFNRLASLAGVGQTANGALQTAGAQFGNNVGNIAMGNAANQGNAALAAGNARASSYQGIGNALGRVNWQDAPNPFGGYNGLGADTTNSGYGMGSAGNGLGDYNVEGYGGGGV